MPDVFESFFQQFGKSPADYYSLKQLDPAYAVFFGHGHVAHLPAHPNARMQLFESYEQGGGKQLQKFLQEAAYKYQVGMQDLVHKPGQSIRELADWRILQGLFRLHLFQSFHRHIRKYFQNPHLLQLLEFPVLFLGATPQKTPALYSLMNYADIALGTWYPKGGMHAPINAMVQLNASLGTQIITNAEVKELAVAGGRVQQVVTDQQTFTADVVIANGDYHHIEQNLLPLPYRSYSAAYWDKRVLAPSCLLYYLGIDKRLQNLLHHNLFFHTSMQQHFHEIYEAPQWPNEPLFYVSCTSQTDPSVAPAGCENLFILIPIAPGLRDTPDIREQYLQTTLHTLEHLTDQTIRDHIVYQKSYAY
ncbi:MAG: phytoene desaturase family protein, partial [Bacteroidota bacterium]